MISLVPRLEHPPLDDLDLRPHLQRYRRHSAQRHVRVGPIRFERMTDDDEELRRGERAVAVPARCRARS